MLEVNSLVVNYGSRKVLQDIDLKLIPGSILALIGPNGAGKSTLIRALSGILPVESGEILIKKQALPKLSPAQIAQYIGVVPQARNLPATFTGWETVALGRTPYLNWLGQLSDKDNNIIKAAMQRTHTLEFSDRLVGELSGGEQQRLLIARALAQSAPILLLDEPTSHLDLQYQLSILDLVHDLAKKDGLAILVAIHDLNLVARYADQVALLVAGKIQATGTPQAVLTSEHLSQAYHVPLKVIPAKSDQPMMVVPVGSLPR